MVDGGSMDIARHTICGLRCCVFVCVWLMCNMSVCQLLLCVCACVCSISAYIYWVFAHHATYIVY